MKKIIALMALVLMFGVAGNASALPILNTSGDAFEDVSGVAYDHYQNSGTLLYSMAGNNMGVKYNDGTLQSEVASALYAIGYDVSGFTLTDATGGITVTGWDSVSGDNVVLNNTYDIDDGYKSGTWAMNNSANVLELYAIKGANGYAMYVVDPADNIGSWSTYDIFIADFDNDGSPDHNGGSLDISHFNGYNTSPVPEPCTMLLFGTGLAGLCLNRRMKKK